MRFYHRLYVSMRPTCSTRLRKPHLGKLPIRSLFGSYPKTRGGHRSLFHFFVRFCGNLFPGAADGLQMCAKTEVMGICCLAKYRSCESIASIRSDFSMIGSFVSLSSSLENCLPLLYHVCRHLSGVDLSWRADSRTIFLVSLFLLLYY